MDLRQLRALVTIAELGSVTKAAEALFLVQTTVTKQIQALERELGVALFDRARYGMELTAAGRILAERADGVFRDLDRVHADLRPAAATPEVVVIGLPESTAALCAGRLLPAVRQWSPVRLHFVYGHSDHLRRRLVAGTLDVALLCDAIDAPELDLAPLLTERLWVVAAPELGLRTDTEIPLSLMAGRPVVLPEPGDPLRDLAELGAAEQGFILDVVAQANSIAMVKQLVRAGRGWALLPAVSILDEVAAGVVSAAPTGDSRLQRTVSVGVSRSRPLSAAAERVRHELVDDVRATAAEGHWPSTAVAGVPR
ncbi:LysR family transcriptional regulator [Nocardia sp. BMG111209]|uniref:LysR family transcriptional regulator n=1 Tax=Nocardia sp. BMG111209 TaxID=1160137 RepID=UPI00035C7DD6|nr:LysR family transcriptional regulator [Nocardia sp. BMG111209]